MSGRTTTNDSQPPRRFPVMPTSTAAAASQYVRSRQDDSWVEIASEPSSSSLSSINNERIAPSRQVPGRVRRRRPSRPIQPTVSYPSSMYVDGTSSQDEYEESESESDRVMTSSGEGPFRSIAPDDDDRTAINQPIKRTPDSCFTPQPNAFSHTSSGTPARSRGTSGSYFPPTGPSSRPTFRHSQSHDSRRPSHLPQNVLSPSYNAAAHHEEALRASLTTLLSCAAAARGLPKSETKRNISSVPQATRNNRVDTMSLRLVPESALPTHSPSQLQEPTFAPSIRRTTSISPSESSARTKETKRKALLAATSRSPSRERRLKKIRRPSSSASAVSTYTSMDEVTPTLLTWVVSAGVVIFLSALSFSAGYGVGREAGKLEKVIDLSHATGTGTGTDESLLGSCAREVAGRSTGLGLKRSLARSAVQV